MDDSVSRYKVQLAISLLILSDQMCVRKNFTERYTNTETETLKKGGWFNLNFNPIRLYNVYMSCIHTLAL